MKIRYGCKIPSLVVLKKVAVFFVVSFILLTNVQVSYAPAYESRESTKKFIDDAFSTALAIKMACEDEAELIGSGHVNDSLEVIDLKNVKKTPEQLYFPIIVKISSRYDVDPLLIKAVIVAESGFKVNAVSRVGAQGLMQLMPGTAKAMGVKDSFNPEHNIAGGVKYLKKLLDKYNGNVEIALAAYNAGSRNVWKYKGVPPYRETKKYIKKVSALHEKYKKTISAPENEILVSQI